MSNIKTFLDKFIDKSKDEKIEKIVILALTKDDIVIQDSLNCTLGDKITLNGFFNLNIIDESIQANKERDNISEDVKA